MPLSSGTRFRHYEVTALPFATGLTPLLLGPGPTFRVEYTDEGI